jgi:hypothetical protein
MTGGAGQTGTRWESVVWGYYKSAGLNTPIGGLEKSLACGSIAFVDFNALKFTPT